MTAVGFEDYVATRSVALQRFAYLVTRNAEDARDLVQDALLGLYPHWSRVSAAGNVDAYVKRSIVNAGISRWRRTGREQVSDELRAVTPDHAAGVTDWPGSCARACRRCSAPRSRCGSTTTWSMPTSPRSWAVRRRPPAPMCIVR